MHPQRRAYKGVADMTSKKKPHKKTAKTASAASAAPFIPYLIPMIPTPPYRFEGLTNFSLFLQADENLTVSESTLVDRYLNEPLGCKGKDCVFEIANTNPLLIFSEVKSSYSIPDGDAQTIAYQEVSIIIPVIVNDRKTAGYFLPILFVDGPPGAKDNWQGAVPIVIGREMYGLPKVRATINFDYTGQKINKGSVSMFGEELLTVTGKADHAKAETGRFSDNQRLTLAEQIFGKIKPNHDHTKGKTAAGHAVDLAHVGHGNPLIGLRQDRNPKKINCAEYQDIVESPYVLVPQTIPYPLGNALTVEFNLKSKVFEGLQLQEKYELPYPIDGAVYSNVVAEFGDPANTIVRPCPA
jgi:hypothetical protein